MTLLFVPVDPATLADWARSGFLSGSCTAVAITASFLGAFGLASADDESAEYTALSVAGIEGLQARGRRLVAVAEGIQVIDAGDEFGRVRVSGVPWTAVTSLFAEGSPELTGGIHDRLRGVELATAWDDPAVDDLLREGDLLWYGASEWKALT